MNLLQKTLIVVTILTSINSKSQDTITFEFKGEYGYNFFFSALTALFDELDRPYIYTASAELGLVTFDISDINNPVPVDTIAPFNFGGDLTNIVQDGNYLYGSTGSFQGTPENAGMVIFDVSTPANAFVTDSWDSAYFDQGAAVVLEDADYAYLGIMDSGMVILDIQNKSNIQFVSHIHPDPNFPQIPGLFSIPNGRGMTFKNDTLYLCNDAGGLRAIDVVDKSNPIEVTQYINITLDATAAPAYNNATLSPNQNFIYVPVDFCGMDVVDISGGTMTNSSWLDPWDCASINWDGAPGHTNQAKVVNDTLLFVSGGDTEILVYDISDQANPLILGEFGVYHDNRVSWGIDVRDEYVVFACINNPFNVPYQSNWGGIQIYQWKSDFLSLKKEESQLTIYPNPSKNELHIDTDASIESVEVFATSGQKLDVELYSNTLNISALTPGYYILHCTINGKTVHQSFVVE